MNQHSPTHHDGWMDGWMDERKDERMDECMVCGQKTLFPLYYYLITNHDILCTNY
jgi:hypothetical protein